MNFHRIVWPLALIASAAMAGGVPSLINAPLSNSPGDLYRAGDNPQQAEDSSLSAILATSGVAQHGDSDFQLAVADRAVELTAALRAPRTWTLACATSVPRGRAVKIFDPGGRITSAHPLSIAPSAAGCSDTLNGSARKIAQLTRPNSVATAISDGKSKWKVAVAAPSAQTLDFVNDFGGVVATAIGTTDCPVKTDGSVHCSNTMVTSTDSTDVFEVQAGKSDGTTLTTTVNGVTPPHDFTITVAPTFQSDTVKIIDALFVCSPPTCSGGSGYSFGSMQSLPKGTGTDIPVTGATPKLMTVVAANVNAGGTMGTNGTCMTLKLAPTHGNTDALSGLQASLSGMISGHALQMNTITVNSGGGANYKSLTGYSYSSGSYQAVPVTGCNLSGASLNVSFGVVTEVISNNPNVYASVSIPCSTSVSIPVTTTSDQGSGLTVTCSSHKPLVSFGQDNKAAIEAVNDYETAQIRARTPVCVTFEGRFLASPVSVISHPIIGGPCLLGNAQILSGIFIFPGTSGDIFPIVDANGSGSYGPIQQQVTDPTNGVMGGTFITNLTFWGDWSSQLVQNAIKFYGFTQWATLENLSSWNVRGCLICVGVDSSLTGQIAESVFFNLRTEFTGDAASFTPAVALDGIGAGNGPNNDLIIRYRAFDDNGLPLALRPCTSSTSDPHTNIHEIVVAELKVEESNMEYSPNRTDSVQAGETAAACNLVAWARSDVNAPYYTSLSVASGVSGLTFVAPNVVNMGVGTAAFHFKGDSVNDLSYMRILGGLVSATGSSNGMGLEFDVSQTGNYVDLVQNNTSDYNLIYSGLVTSGALEYDAHDQTTTALIDPGINVMTTLRCVLGLPLTGCTLSGPTFIGGDAKFQSGLDIAHLLISPTAPTISSGFGGSASIVANNGTAAFQVNVGTGGSASSGTIGLPTAANGWSCEAKDITTQTVAVFLTKQTASTTTSATFTNYNTSGAATAWVASNKLNISCHAF